MTTQQATETIRQLFPQVTNTQAIIELNRAQEKFARETGVLRKIGNLQTLTSKVAWALASDCISIYDVELYDSNGVALDKIDYDLDWFIDDGYIIFYDTSSDAKITTIPSSISTIWVRYTHLPTALVVGTADIADTAFEVGNQFAEGVLAIALETLYARYPVPMGVDGSGNVIKMIDRDTRDYWRSKYLEVKIDAKKYMNKLDETPRRTINYDHAGVINLPKEAKNATVTATNWS